MTCDILIKTCAYDAEYHRHCMASISKFCTGFRKTVVVEDTDPPPKQPYLFQQVVKLKADQHTDADLILVTDSDTLFSEHVTPESFMREGKPIWYMTPWTEEMLAHPGTREWFFVLKNFFGQDPPAEFMRRQPFMFPREVLKGLRNYCYNKFEKTIDDYVMDSGKFSEWNVLGMYCWLHHRELFYWMDTSVECPPPKVRQFWSHDPVEKNIAEIRSILA